MDTDTTDTEDTQTTSDEAEQTQTEPKPSGKTFSESYVSKLRSESAGYRKEASEAKKRLQEQADSMESLTRERDTAVHDNLKLTVAAEKALPPGFQDRLRGTTRDELESDADALLEVLGTAQRSVDVGQSATTPEDSRPDDPLLDATMKDPR